MVQRKAAGGEALPIGFEPVPAPPSITIEFYSCRL